MPRLEHLPLLPHDKSADRRSYLLVVNHALILSLACFVSQANSASISYLGSVSVLYISVLTSHTALALFRV